MKLSYLLYIVILSVSWLRNAESNEITPSFKLTFEEISRKEYPLTTFNSQQRGIKDLWNNIKNTAIKSWNYVKKIAENTKQKINKWIENVKNRANAITKALEERMENLKDKLFTLINDIFVNNENAKQCLEEGKKGVEDAFKGILKNMAKCIANEMKKLAHLNRRQSELVMNDTQFLNELEEKHEMCAKDPENVEECFFKVREQILNDTENLEDDVLNNRLESRNIADDILNTILSCSTESLIEATRLITKEVLTVSKCILEAKKQNGTSNLIKLNSII